MTNKDTSYDDGLIPDITGRKQLCDLAEKRVGNVSDGLKPCAYMYYLARYLVSVFEARHHDLPIQVWNEYRNALDHFMRHVSLVEPDHIYDDKHQHISKMETHLQRAVLDVSKLLCVRSGAMIDKELESWGKDALDLVDGGRLLTEINTVHEEAIALFEKAKINDGQLGDNIDANKCVLYNYLDSYFKYRAVILKINANRQVISDAYAKIKQMQDVLDRGTEAIRDELRREMAPKALIRAAILAVIVSGFFYWLGNQNFEVLAQNKPTTNQQSPSTD